MSLKQNEWLGHIKTCVLLKKILRKHGGMCVLVGRRRERREHAKTRESYHTYKCDVSIHSFHAIGVAVSEMKRHSMVFIKKVGR